jgi:anti-anti-sigma factor
MELVTDRLNGIVFAEAWNRVDGTNAREFEKALKEAITREDRAMIIDFEHLKYISSAGLRAILLTAKLLRKRNAKFGLCFLSEPIREVFAISGFDKIIAIHGSRAEALATLGP